MCNNAIIGKESVNFFNSLYDKIDTKTLIKASSYKDIRKLDPGEQAKCFIGGNKNILIGTRTGNLLLYLNGYPPPFSKVNISYDSDTILRLLYPGINSLELELEDISYLTGYTFHQGQLFKENFNFGERIEKIINICKQYED